MSLRLLKSPLSKAAPPLISAILTRTAIMAAAWLWIMATPEPGAARPIMTDQTFVEMNNIGGITQGMSIHCIAQDSSGMIWMGSDKGLLSYDGYDLRNYGSPRLGMINGLTVCHDSLYLGCTHGMAVFSLHNRQFLSEKRHPDEYVYCCLDEWVGTNRGLYHGERKADAIGHVFSLTGHDGRLYAGTATGIYRQGSHGDFARIGERLYNVYSMAILSDSMNRNGQSKQTKLYAGTPNALLTIDAQKHTITDSLPMPVVKTLLLTTHQTQDTATTLLLIGTDNGLYVLPAGSRTPRQIMHDAFLPQTSLASNVVWNLYEDRDRNIWIGTDNGVSIIARQPTIEWHRLSDITHRHDGCLIDQILTDSRQRLWLGGFDGLICVDQARLPETSSYRWFRMNDEHFPIGHNRIRCLIESKSGRIWIGGDGGLMHYDEGQQQLVRHPISSDTTNWVYDLCETETGDLWVTTYEGCYLWDTEKQMVKEKLPLKKVTKNVLKDAKGRSWHRSGHPDDPRLWTGGSDRFGFATLEMLERKGCGKKVTITQVSVIGTRDIGNDSVRQGRIVLPYRERNLQVTFSDFDFEREHLAAYHYRIVGAQDPWIDIDCGDNKIILMNLSPGQYSLEIAPKTIRKSSMGKDEAAITALTVIIERPWYSSIPMLLLYGLLCIALVVGVICYAVQHKTLRLEREQREMMLINAKRKERELQEELVVTAQNTNASGETPSTDDSWLHKTTRIIETGMEDPEFSATTLAEKSDLSTKQLYRKIKHLTGMTTVEYIRLVRMDHAAYLLTHGNFTIAEVMYRVGFTNASYFSKSFAARHGMTPTDYKKGKTKPECATDA